jgi:hypothetical protein
VRLVVFCEAVADFRIASDLVDRVLRHDGPGWVVDLLDAAPDGLRSWRGDGRGNSFFAFHQLTKHVEQLAIRVPHGHFDGRPGAADAVMARTALSIVRHFVKRGEIIDAVFLVRDMDDQPQRETGLGQARTEARSWTTLPIVLGCANPMREAWILCGFDPETDAERARLQELRQELGFQPHEQAHHLDAQDDQAKRSAKRVLRLLTGDDREREERCWKHTALDKLRTRGVVTGLCNYLDEVRQHLIPLVLRL